jgi:Uma2 family endonuclease
MGVPTIDTGPITVADFYAFTDRRPDEEKWELIDGELILNASSAYLHQKIVGNVLYALTLQFRRHKSRWHVIPGIGVLVSDISRPEPDLMIVPPLGAGADPGQRDTKDAVVVFEVMSPSTSNRDLKWKRAAYTGMPALTHYVVLAQDQVEAVVFARDNGFAEQRLRLLTDAIAFPALGVTLPLSEIYDDIEFARSP